MIENEHPFEPTRHFIKIATVQPRHVTQTEPITARHAQRLFNQLVNYGQGMRIELHSITFNKVIASHTHRSFQKRT